MGVDKCDKQIWKSNVITVFSMKLKTFLDYYKPLDSEMKIDKLFELFFKSNHQPICATSLSKIMDATNEDIKNHK